jgi:GT2 family glycosyltransferase
VTALSQYPPAAAIVLNWNGHHDTVSCLAHVLQTGYPALQVFVCDNGSTDDSVEHLSAWLASATRRDPSTGGLRPLRWARVEGGEAPPPNLPELDLLLVCNDRNLGYAGGNNVALRLALRQTSALYFWILNNDTEPEASALGELVARMQAIPSCGLCGSALIDQRDPRYLQALGGVFAPWLARTRQFGAGAPAAGPFDDDTVTAQVDYVIGASMLLSRPLLEAVGLLAEDYFLYFEELDLIYRARGRFGFACATRSRVRHQWGASINPAHLGRVSTSADYYFSRARILFTRRHFARAMPTVVLAVISSAFVRLLRAQPRNAAAVMRGLLDGLRGRTGAMA